MPIIEQITKPKKAPCETKPNVKLKAIPAEMRERKQWVVWRYEHKDDQQKPAKVPVNPITGRYASSTDESTWGSFDEACKALVELSCDGLMFALTEDDGIVFIDLDACRNPQNKTFKKWARDILTDFDTYCEVSPSGRGAHLLIKGTKPGDGCKKGDVECYSEKRFLTVTGRVLKNYGNGEIEERQSQLEDFYRKHLNGISQNGGNRAVPAVPVPPELLAKLLENKKARSIYDGEAYDYLSQSEADLALASIAVHQGLSDGHIRTILESARENAGANEKYAGYFDLTIHKARGVDDVLLGQAHGVFCKWLLLPDTTILDVMLAICASPHLPGDPLWLHIVAPPATAKTEIIRSVQDWPTVYALTELTKAGLVSGINSESGEDHSLLPKLDGKTLAIKDFTVTLKAGKEERAKVDAALRDAYDGYSARHTALVGTRSHKGRFNCITGVTDAIESMAKNSTLGERFLLLRHRPSDPRQSGLRALNSTNAKTEMRATLKNAACGVLAGVDQDCIPSCEPTIKDKMVSLAMILAKARTFVHRDHNHHVTQTVQSEGPSRIVQQLYKLGQGLALINRRAEVVDEDLQTIARVAMDSMPAIRWKILSTFLCNPGKMVTTKFLQEEIGSSQSAVREQLENLRLLDILSCKKEKRNGKDVWFNCLTAEFRELFGDVPWEHVD